MGAQNGYLPGGIAPGDPRFSRFCLIETTPPPSVAGWGWVVVVVVAGGGWWCGWVQAGFRLGAAGCKGKVIGFDYYYLYSI